MFPLTGYCSGQMEPIGLIPVFISRFEVEGDTGSSLYFLISLRGSGGQEVRVVFKESYSFLSTDKSQRHLVITTA